MKKFLSTILAVVMVLSSMAMVVSAEDTFVYETGKYYVGQTSYDSFSAAVSAANGGTVIVSGTVEFGSRQGISSSVTLQGVNDATIVPSASYGSTESTTNWKGLLNTSGENVIINNITFDGSVYGDQFATASAADFKILRVTAGKTTLNGVTLEGSKRGLLQVGTEDTSAEVVASNLTAIAEPKTMNDTKTYADILVVNGDFSMDSGDVDGYISTDWQVGKGSLDVTAPGYFTFENDYLYFWDYYICATPGYIAYSYNYASDSMTNSEIREYRDALTENDSVTQSMMAYVNTNSESMAEEKAALNTMLDDMLTQGWASSYTTYIQNYKTILNRVAE